MDPVIERIKQEMPSAEVELLNRHGPDSEWAFSVRSISNLVVVSSTDGNPPFRIDDRRDAPVAHSSDEAVDRVVARLRAFQRFGRLMTRILLLICLACAGLCFVWLSFFTPLPLWVCLLIAVPAGFVFVVVVAAMEG
jgi:hypothetical protein